MAGREREDGGYEYVCTRAELAGIGIGPYADPEPRRNGLRKLQAAMAAATAPEQASDEDVVVTLPRRVSARYRARRIPIPPDLPLHDEGAGL